MILLKPGSGRPLYLQIYDQVRAAIVSGELKKDSRLPSILGLSETLGMGKNTVSLAYSQLAAEGYIRNLERSGFYVQDLSNQGVVLTDVSPSWEVLEQQPGPVPEYTHDFRYGRVNPKDFPLNLWRKLSNQVLTPFNLGSIVSYPDPLGEPGLRQALAAHLNRDRGVVCQSGQVVICAGTQQSLNLICRLLKDAFPSVAMEEPGYSGARVIFENNDLNIIPVRLDRGGIRMKALEKSGAGLAYQTPSLRMSYMVIPLGMMATYKKVFDRSGCESERIRQAQNQSVAVSPVIQYWHRSGSYKNNMVALGYSGLDEDRIAGGVDLLNRAWF